MIYTSHYAGYKVDPELARNLAILLDDVVAPLIAPGSRILDVGCGAGTFLEVAGAAGYNAYGIDVSEGAAEICRAKGCRAVSADFLSLGEEGSFELVTMWDVLEHLRDPVAFIDRSTRMLRPGGVFIAKVPTYGRFSVALSKRSQKLRRVLLDAPDHIQYFRTSSLRALLSRSAMADFQIEPIAGGMRTPPSGGSLRRRLGRNVKRAIASVSGEGNALIVARAPSL